MLRPRCTPAPSTTRSGGVTTWVTFLDSDMSLRPPGSRFRRLPKVILAMSSNWPPSRRRPRPAGIGEGRRSADVPAAPVPPPRPVRRSVGGVAGPEPIEEHRHDDEGADEGALPEGADAEQNQTVADHLDEGGPDDRAEGGAGAARQVRAADHRGGDDGQLHALAEARGDRAQPADLQDAGDAGAERAHHVDAHL